MKPTVDELCSQLHTTDNKAAYKSLQTLQQISEESADVYSHMDEFCDMLESDNSYIRTRGLTLIAYNAKWDTDYKVDDNAKWDTDYKVDEIINKYLEHITDEKPITARQCIKLLPRLAKAKPELKNDIIDALRKANISVFSGSMQPLIHKDLINSLEEIQKV